jgi:hypothetical protein
VKDTIDRRRAPEQLPFGSVGFGLSRFIGILRGNRSRDLTVKTGQPDLGILDLEPYPSRQGHEESILQTRKFHQG